VAFIEIFHFLLFLRFGVAVPEDEEEKVEVEVDPAEDPNGDPEVLSDDISDGEFFKGCE
jgi:hypothetical protein